MKLPTIAPTVQLPEGHYAPQASAGLYGQVAGQAAQGLGQVSAAANQFASQAINAEQRQAEKPDKAYLQAVDVEKSNLSSEMDLDAGTKIQALKDTERDPDAFAKAAEKVLKDAYEAVDSRTKYPETKIGLNKAYNELRVQRGLEIVKHRGELEKGLVADNTKNALANLAVLGANAPERNLVAGGEEPGTGVLVKSRVDYYKEGLQTLEAASGRLGVDKVGEMKRDWRDSYWSEAGNRDVQAHPFTADTEKYRNVIKPESFDRLEAKKDRLQLATVKANEAATKALEAQAEKQRQVDLTYLTDEYYAKTLTPARVAQARDEGLIINDTEHRHFMDLATKQNDDKSDRAIWSAVQADVWSVDPAYKHAFTETKIRALMAAHVNGQPGLDGNNGRMALAELGRHRNEGTTEANHDRVLANDAYQKAKEEGLRRLGINSPMQVLDKTKDKLSRDFVTELNALVLDPQTGLVRTNVPLRQAMLDIMPRHEARQDADTRSSFQEMATNYRESTGSTPPDMTDSQFPTWYNAEKAQVEALKKDPKTMGLYTLRRDQLLGMWRTYQETLQSLQRRAEQGKKSTGGYSATPEKK